MLLQVISLLLIMLHIPIEIVTGDDVGKLAFKSNAKIIINEFADNTLTFPITLNIKVKATGTKEG